jgi:hypothetical protein
MATALSGFAPKLPKGVHSQQPPSASNLRGGQLVGLLIFGLALSACGEATLSYGAPASGQRAPTIVNGQLDTGHPSVGMLTNSADGRYCTVTLIGQQTVVTAGHCVGDPLHYTVTLGGAQHVVADKFVRPEWMAIHGTQQLTQQAAGVDLAVLRLATAPAVSPTAISSTPPAVGVDLTLVGFGQTGPNATDGGLAKRRALSQVAQVAAATLVWGGTGNGLGTTCAGDSGGPQFVETTGQSVQVSVTSGGDCATFGMGPRLDRYLPWIVQVSGGVITGSAGGPTPQPDVGAGSSLDAGAGWPAKPDTGGGWSPPPKQDSGGGWSPPPKVDSGGGWSPPNKDSGGGWSPPKKDTGGGWSPPNKDTGGGWSPPKKDSGGGWSPPKKDSGGGWSPPKKDSGGGWSPPPKKDSGGKK